MMHLLRLHQISIWAWLRLQYWPRRHGQGGVGDLGGLRPAYRARLPDNPRPCWESGRTRDPVRI